MCFFNFCQFLFNISVRDKIKLSQIVREQQNLLLGLYLKAITEGELREIEQFLPPHSYKNQAELIKEFVKLDKAVQLKIGNHQARIADMHTRVRNSINSKFATHFAEESPIDASSFKFVIEKADEAGLTADQLQKILKETVISNSVTAHPTNPYDTNYTVESMELDRILSESDSEEKTARLQAQIAKMIQMSPVPLVGEKNKGKKTQADEVLEAMSYMQNIYKSLPTTQREMQKVLAGTLGYEDVEIGNFYDMGAWLAGDGDGNPAATANSLQNNIDLFRAEIIGLYLSDLLEIKTLLNKELSEIGSASEQKSKIEKILNAIIGIEKKLELKLESKDDDYKDHLVLVKELKNINRVFGMSDQGSELQQKIQDLTYRVENFGFRYAKIDIRHDASDINSAVAEVLLVLGKFDEEGKKVFLKDLEGNKNVNERAADLSKYLYEVDKNPNEIFARLQDKLDQIVKNLAAFSQGDKSPEKEQLEKDKKSMEATLRVFGRLQIVAKNPGCSDKLIIAECKNQANALGALFLLKETGNSVNKKDSLNVVTLSESADDLIALPENIEALLRNPTYRAHVVATGKLIYMIAKSDTQRRDGVGAQFAQELPPEYVTKVFAKLAREYEELKSVTLVPFNGGGHALQRGGGRIDEVPNVYGKAEMRGLEWSAEGEKLEKNIKIAPPILTTQGHQNGILYSADSAVNSLTSYLSQSVWKALKRVGIIKEPEVLNDDRTPNLFAQEARANRKIFFEAARSVYKSEIITPNSPINMLFRNGPWAGVDLTNVSSRPGKRVESSDLQLTDQRAIGADKMCTHSGTHLINWYSAKAGLQAIIDTKGLEVAHLMYREDKSTRDSFRSMSMSLFMSDFDVACKMMVGSERPTTEEIKVLAQKYNTEEFKTLGQEEQNKVTISHIEVEAIETSKLIYQIIKNKKSVEEDLSNFTPQDLLKSFWPDLAAEIADREQRLKFSHLVEAYLTSALAPDEKRYPKSAETEQAIRVWNTACMGSEAPVGSMLTLTKLNEDGLPRTGHEFEIDGEGWKNHYQL
jgi:phosphoenolpyruvate carboxylase